jgi:hypothetical protein
MADELDLSSIVRRTVQANARLYKGWVDLSLEYFRGIADIFGGVPEPASSPADELGGGAGAVVLEGEEGATGHAAFLVTNDLGSAIQCALVASEFRDSDGNVARVKVGFEPAKFDLEPGQQAVVNVTVPIDGDLAEGVAYSAEFAFKGMDGFSVPAVLRRRNRVEASPIDLVAETEAGKATASSFATVRRSTRRTKGATKKTATKKSATKKSATKKSATKKRSRRKTTRKPRKKKS